jgi:hypothetical protein
VYVPFPVVRSCSPLKSSSRRQEALNRLLFQTNQSLVTSAATDPQVLRQAVSHLPRDSRAGG